jgi:hypothetical protein
MLATYKEVHAILEDELPLIHTEFDSINSGGCGYMAQFIAEQLDLLGMDYNVVCDSGVYSTTKYTNQEVNTLIDDEMKSSMPNSHIVIEVGGKYFDSDGETEMEEEDISALIDRETIERMNSNFDYWNRSFNRNQVEGMREYTKKIFKNAFKHLSISVRTPMEGLT